MAKRIRIPKITIRMPKKLLASWLKALRSGEHKQGQGQLGDEINGFCCLGLLEHVAGGEQDPSTHGFPSLLWMERNKVTFRVNSENGGCNSPALRVRNGVVVDAAYANDSLGWDFKSIADLVEKKAEGF